MNARLFKNLAMPIALVAICLFFAVKESAFLGPRNLTQLIVEFSITGTLALGMFMILLTGQIDLSVGSGVGLVGGIAAVLVFQHNWPAPLAMLAAFAAALVLWTSMGTLIVKQRIPSFIITLGGLLIFKGLFWLVIQNSTVPVSRGDQDNLYSLLTTYYLPAPIGLALVAGNDSHWRAGVAWPGGSRRTSSPRAGNRPSPRAMGRDDRRTARARRGL
jgi:D-xylose transport system permease protein